MCRRYALEFSTTIAMGAVGGGWWAARHPKHHEDHAQVAASGLLAGAGVMGVVTALVSIIFGDPGAGPPPT